MWRSRCESVLCPGPLNPQEVATIKPLYGLLVDQFTVVDNVLLNLLVLYVIERASYRIAFRSVGDLLGARPGLLGSIAHWTLRFFVFASFVYLVRAAVWTVRTVTTPVGAVTTVLMIAVSLLGIWLWRRRRAESE